MPCESNRSQNGAITNAHLRDDMISTTDETGCQDDTVLTTEDEDTPSDAEFATLRDMLPNDVGEGTTQGYPDGEGDSIVPEDATCAYFSKKVVILSDTLRFMQYLEGRNKRLRQENTALGLIRIIYAWRMMTGISGNVEEHALS
ncbi:hypothetical protein B0J14DRAFT_569956 [Halenospora varia]|nr:hypothetical protein B0J14DRAFT_569956 [Halenospora varia]